MCVLIKTILCLRQKHVSVFVRAPETQLPFRIWGSKLMTNNNLLGVGTLSRTYQPVKKGNNRMLLENLSGLGLLRFLFVIVKNVYPSYLFPSPIILSFNCPYSLNLATLY